jgi:hypothetical protein
MTRSKEHNPTGAIETLRHSYGAWNAFELPEAWETFRAWIEASRESLKIMEMASGESERIALVPMKSEGVPVSYQVVSEQHQKEEQLQLQIEYLRSTATQERRLAARESQRCDELSERNKYLSKIIAQLTQQNAELVKSCASLASVRTSASELQVKFTRLVTEWKSTRGHSSKLIELVMHPAYQQIIGMGNGVVSIILKEMKERPDHWDWALRAITGSDPVPREAWGKLKQIGEAWIAWGINEGYIQ